MTLKEIKDRYKNAIKVTCAYDNTLPIWHRTIYIPDLNTIRKLTVKDDEYVCSDISKKTAYICLSHKYKGFAQIIESKKDSLDEEALTITGMHMLDLSPKPKFAELITEANKYISIGNIVSAVKKYKENETPLDIQLREFKKQQNNE